MRVCGPAETSETYRAARAALLDAEMALRDQREVVAALRREGEAVPDYVFHEGPTDLDDEAPQAGTDVRLSELFFNRQGRADRRPPDVRARGRERVPDVHDVGGWLQRHRSTSPSRLLKVLAFAVVT